MSAQLAFDFEVSPAPLARPLKVDFSAERDRLADASSYWRAGMVTSLPLFCEIEGVGGRYTQMLPGVIEAIAGDLASVRIYAAPEYGYILEGYPLHLALAINVPLHALGRHHWNTNLQRIADEGLLATGDAALAAKVRGQLRAIARVA